MPPKKAAAPKPKGPSKSELKKGRHGVLVVLFDCGSNMGMPKDKNTFEMAKETLDWVISRKIFAELPDKIAIVLFGSNETNNSLNFDGVYVHNEPSRASFDQLKFVHNELQIGERKGDLGQGLAVALNVMKKYIDDYEPFIDTRHLLLISNGESENSTFAKEAAKFGKTFRDLEVDLIAIGIEKDNAHKTAKWAFDLVDETKGSQFDFTNIISGLSHFIPKQTEGRLNNKFLEIAPGIRLPVAFSLKSFQAKSGLKPTLVDPSGAKVVRHVETNLTSDDPLEEKPRDVLPSNNEPKSDEFDEFDDESFFEEKPKFGAISRENLCKGYFFGQTLIFFDENEDKESVNHNFNEGERGGCLKLVQFTSRQNIPPSYFIGKQSYTVLPAVNKQTASKFLNVTRATVALMESMLELDVVAICRYAYDAGKHLQLMALIPHRDEDSGSVFLRGLRLPFADDMRCLKFPRLESSLPEDQTATAKKKSRTRSPENSEYSTKPTVSQLATVDGLIDLMSLEGNAGNDFGSGTVLDPLLQMQCNYVKNRVLKGEGDEISNERKVYASKLLQKSLAPNSEVLVGSSEFFGKFADEFNLQKIEKVKRTRVQVAPIDISAKIADAQNLNRLTKEKVGQTTETKAKKRLAEAGELNLEEQFSKNAHRAAEENCHQQLYSIAALCMIPLTTLYANSIFKLPEDSLQSLRRLCVQHNEWQPFNELLQMIRSDGKYANFVDHMGDAKSFTLISNEECVGSDVSAEKAHEFWEEIDGDFVDIEFDVGDDGPTEL